eukprot:3382832-Alexandrium_andersonii.AAC.1
MRGAPLGCTAFAMTLSTHICRIFWMLRLLKNRALCLVALGNKSPACLPLPPPTAGSPSFPFGRRGRPKQRSTTTARSTNCAS